MSQWLRTLVVLLVGLSLGVGCHELLSDFFEFSDVNSDVKLTKGCADDLLTIKHGIASNEVWALKGERVLGFD